MTAFCDELEACLADLRGMPDLDATGILPAAKPQPGGKPQPGRKPARADAASTPRRRRRWPLVVAVLVIAALAVTAAAIVIDRDNGSGGGGGGGGGSGGGASLVPAHLTAVSAYDPYGDHHENDSAVPYATDGNMSTFWETEHYRYGNGDMNKPGVGIILRAPSSVKARQLVVYSTTPGYRALIQSSDNEYGPFTPDSQSVVGSSRTAFALHGATARYYLIWITNLGPSNYVTISEVDGSV